jgi:hypothetical protein
MRIPTPSPPLVTPGGIGLSDSEKAEALADSLKAQFQLVSNPSVPAVIEVVNEAVRAYSYAPASKPKLTNPTEVQDAIRGFNGGKAPGPDGVPIRALKHLPLSVVSFLIVLFNTICRTQYSPAAWKYARVFSILKSRKDPALPSSYRPISLLDTTVKLFEKILLSRILYEVSEVRNSDKKRLTGAVFLDVAKAFDTVCVDGLLYKLTILNFSSCLVKTISSYLNS